MRLTAYSAADIRKGCYKKSDLLVLIEEFVNSDMECAKVEGFTHKSACSCASSFNLAIKRYNKGGIKAISRKNEVFLIKTNK